jgi:hypothetical protein
MCFVFEPHQKPLAFLFLASVKDNSANIIAWRARHAAMAMARNKRCVLPLLDLAQRTDMAEFVGHVCVARERITNPFGTLGGCWKYLKSSFALLATHASHAKSKLSLFKILFAFTPCPLK